MYNECLSGRVVHEEGGGQLAKIDQWNRILLTHSLQKQSVKKGKYGKKINFKKKKIQI